MVTTDTHAEAPADPDPTPRSGGLLRPSSWSLRAKLVASMLALFTVITLITAAASLISLDRYLLGQIDDQLRQSVSRYTNGPTQGQLGTDRVPGDDRRGPGDEGIVVIVQDGVPFTRVRDNLSDDQVTTLMTAAGKDPSTLRLGDDTGQYRVLSAARGTTTIIMGLPIGRQSMAVTNALLTAGLTTFLGLLVVGVGGAWLVKRNLRPLVRVADTATRVSKLHLASGQVALAERVDPADTDPRTEVGRVGLALNELLDHVDDALTARHESEQRVRQFVADASHELRTPLASIRGYAELTRREPAPVPPSVTHALGRVESEATRMSHLVDDLLLLARLDAGRPLDLAPVDLTGIVVNAVSDAHAASPGHVWRLDVPDEPVMVLGDAARLHQIVVNLLANSRVHTVPGTTVRATLTHEAATVRLAVHDTGPGVPVDLQRSVFQRFARGDTSRNRAQGSTGLGLSIVAAVASAHGGTVALDSRPGDTTFTVALPAAPA